MNIHNLLIFDFHVNIYLHAEKDVSLLLPNVIVPPLAVNLLSGSSVGPFGVFIVRNIVTNSDDKHNQNMSEAGEKLANNEMNQAPDWIVS